MPPVRLTQSSRARYVTRQLAPGVRRSKARKSSLVKRHTRTSNRRRKHRRRLVGRTRKGGITDSQPYKSTHREVFKKKNKKYIQTYPKNAKRVHEYAELSVHLFGLTTQPTTFTACFFYVFETRTEPPKRFVFFKLERHPSVSKKHNMHAISRYVLKDDRFNYDGTINGETQDKKHTLNAPTFREDETDKYEQQLASYRWDENDDKLQPIPGVCTSKVKEDPLGINMGTSDNVSNSGGYTMVFSEFKATVDALQNALQTEGLALPNIEDTISWFAYFLRHMTFLHLYKTGNEKIKWTTPNTKNKMDPEHKYHMWCGPAKGTWIIQDDDSSVSNFLKTNDFFSRDDPNSVALHEDDATITEEVQFYNQNIRTGNEIFIPGSVRVIERFRTFINQTLPLILTELLPGPTRSSAAANTGPGTVGNLSQTNAAEVNSL